MRYLLAVVFVLLGTSVWAKDTAVYDKYNRFKGVYRQSSRDVKFYNKRGIYQGRYTKNNVGSYNYRDKRNVYQGRGPVGFKNSYKSTYKWKVTSSRTSRR